MRHIFFEKIYKKGNIRIRGAYILRKIGNSKREFMKGTVF